MTSVKRSKTVTPVLLEMNYSGPPEWSDVATSPKPRPPSPTRHFLPEETKSAQQWFHMQKLPELDNFVFHKSYK